MSTNAPWFFVIDRAVLLLNSRRTRSVHGPYVTKDLADEAVQSCIRMYSHFHPGETPTYEYVQLEGLDQDDPEHWKHVIDICASDRNASKLHYLVIKQAKITTARIAATTAPENVAYVTDIGVALLKDIRRVLETFGITWGGTDSALTKARKDAVTRRDRENRERRASRAKELNLPPYPSPKELP